MKNMYCNNCKQNVGGKVDISPLYTVILIALLFLGFIPGVIFLVYIYTSTKFRSCPICAGTNFDGSKTLGH